jgi:hypothetical protein
LDGKIVKIMSGLKKFTNKLGARDQAEIRRQTIHETLFQKYPIQEKLWPSGTRGRAPAYQA